MKMILDVDTGIDDALAIAYAIGKEEIDLIGITTVFGNVNVYDASKNSLNILKLLDSENIPVYLLDMNKKEVESFFTGRMALGILL